MDKWEKLNGGEEKLEESGFSCLGQLKFSEDISCLPSGKLSIGMECLDRDLWDMFPAIPQLKKLGIKQARIQSGWAKTEQQKGVYDFSWLDSIVDSLLAIGIQPWLSLSYGNKLYSSDPNAKSNGIGQNPCESEEYLNAWKKYVRAAVSHFKGRIQTFEIWNEPDLCVFFPASSGDWMVEYNLLVRETSPIVKEIIPSAKVGAVMAEGTATAANIIARLFDGGLGKWIDFFAFHAYSLQPERFNEASRRVFYDMFGRLAPHVELWRGEAGIASENPEGGQGALCEIDSSENIQARWVARHIIRDLADAGLSLTSCFHLYDFVHYSHKYRYHYGMLREDYSSKPAFFILQRLKMLLDDGNAFPASSYFLEIFNSSSSKLDQSQLFNVAVACFERAGYPLFAYWSCEPVTSDLPITTVMANFVQGSVESVFRQPVVVDLFSGKVYEVIDYRCGHLADVPITNYPFILTDAAALSAFGDFTYDAKDETLVIEQRNHE